ncbi:MAG TPA: hypothetical protein VF599_12410 [Pyrinomonadaceae bacterium]|jgi:hypothetical protein
MPNLTPEKEQEILDALAAKLAAIEGIDNIVTDDFYTDSKHDVLDRLTVQNSDDETEIKYCYLTFQSFEDSTTDGCDDNPVVFLVYNAHLMWQYKPARSDGSTPQKDLKRLVINLRNKFLQKNRTLAENCEHLPLKQNNFIILGDDPLTDVEGYYVDLQIKVEIT